MSASHASLTGSAAPPRSRRHGFDEGVDEAPQVLDHEPVEIEQEHPSGCNESVEQVEPAAREPLQEE